MAKTAVVNRDKRRRKTVRKYAARRKDLLEIINSPRFSQEDRYAARLKMQQLPRDANPIRLRNRCALTGRPRGVYKKFGLARSKLRDIAMRGEIPGVIKASW